jgi:hypothetical protein
MPRDLRSVLTVMVEDEPAEARPPQPIPPDPVLCALLVAVPTASRPEKDAQDSCKPGTVSCIRERVTFRACLPS